jgi:hypothetical protein
VSVVCSSSGPVGVTGEPSVSPDGKALSSTAGISFHSIKREGAKHFALEKNGGERCTCRKAESPIPGKPMARQSSAMVGNRDHRKVRSLCTSATATWSCNAHPILLERDHQSSRPEVRDGDYAARWTQRTQSPRAWRMDFTLHAPADDARGPESCVDCHGVPKPHIQGSPPRARWSCGQYELSSKPPLPDHSQKRPFPLSGACAAYWPPFSGPQLKAMNLNPAV